MLLAEGKIGECQRDLRSVVVGPSRITVKKTRASHVCEGSPGNCDRGGIDVATVQARVGRHLRCFSEYRPGTHHRIEDDFVRSRLRRKDHRRRDDGG